MHILVTGAKGFIGKNLIADLKATTTHHIFEFDKDTDPALLDEYCRRADFIFHLAGVNRPQNEAEFMTGNFGFTQDLLHALEKHQNKATIVLSSSIQAELENPYGKSKKAGEDVLLDYAARTGARVIIYRFPNVFGKWCRPNYNSAVATFCYNIARDKEITVHDPNTPMTLVYIDDVIDEMKAALAGKEHTTGSFGSVPVTHQVLLGEIVELLHSFKESRINKTIPNKADPFTKKLYSTYLSYLPENEFAYPAKMNIDHRGSFTELLRTVDRGQVSVNISKPGITKGNHWHHTKNEKFIVVSGKGVIRFRRIDSEEVQEYFVSGDKIEIVDIPVGYTHNIENVGDTDMVTVMWANEPFDQEKPDTYFLEV